MSEDFQTWLASLSPYERERFVKMLKDDNTYVAEDMTDLLAILDHLQEQKKTN